YQFTENISGAWDWLLPGIFIGLGTFLNARFTRKIPLILAWVGGFFLQALIRSWWFGTPLAAGLNPMLGVAFLLFTFYMVTDPATTPFKPACQVLFGASVAAIYGVLMALHVVFGFFFALFIVCGVRGAWLYCMHLREARLAGALATRPLSLGKEASP
ncbi:MAG: enediyne biosynthesis protein UnbU, partial [Pseudomonadota bacterium]|nr:enediyne biosynthesis protein UnbU [Pseudomonadota bacterium]